MENMMENKSVLQSIFMAPQLEYFCFLWCYVNKQPYFEVLN